MVGDRLPQFAAQESIEPAVGHAARALGVAPPEVRWVATDALEDRGPELIAGAAGVWCAPGSPYRSLDGALAGIRWAREHGVPFLGTCAGFQHAVIEFARHVLGHASATHAEYGGEGELFIDELLCSLVGQTMDVDLVDPELARLYGGAPRPRALLLPLRPRPAWRAPLEAAGLRVGGVDAADGDARILRLDGHPFFVCTLFVPQTSSSEAQPHPLVTSFVRAVVRLVGA